MVGVPREAAPSKCLLWSSPVVLTGGQIPNVLFDEEVGLWHKVGDSSGCLLGAVRAGPHLPATAVPVGTSCASWPMPQPCGQGMDLGSTVSPRPAHPPATTARLYSPSCPQWLSCAAALSASAYPAGRPRTATKQQGLSCEWVTDPPLKSPSCGTLPLALSALLQPQPWLWQTRRLGRHATPLARVLCASQTLGMCSKITNKGMGEEVNKAAEAHTPNSHGKPSGCGT